MTTENSNESTTETSETEATENSIDWKARAREWEKRAKENKSAAEELAALKDTQKSSEQKFEERLADLTTKITESEAKALRSAIAAEYGISTKKGPKGEPSDADLFLTGSDEATLTAQAKRLAERVAEQKKQGNVAPKEGGTTNAGKGDEEMREFTRSLFARAD